MELKWNTLLSLILLTLAVLLLMSPVSAFAEDNGSDVSTEDVEEIEENEESEDRDSTTTYSDGSTYNPDDELPQVSIDQANDWADRRGEDATTFLQIGGQWLAIIVFIISAIMTLFGAIAGRISKGLIGIFIAIIMYTGITFAPLLIDFFSQWLAS